MQDIDKDIIKLKYFRTLPYLNQERTQKFFGITLTILALMFFGFFAVNPTISAILKLKKEVADSEFVYSQLGDKLKNLSQLRNRYDNLQSDLNVITDSIPIEPNAHLLFAQIQTIALQSNIKIKTLNNYEVEVIKNNKISGKKYYSYSFNISGEGSFENISKFISAITGMQRIISIDSFTIVDKNSQSLGFTIQGTTFFKE
ncbi:MAG: type 4a pilus biogenesis protein PilO [Candidatus Levybacteria bacterium]|nr:type 4a pilus biogenesis protein PilO [Candidatus Levybacteria bacterium]